jgi:hypothetical protein
MSQLTLSIDNAAGGQDRIRVGLLGGDVGASISVGDGSTADRLRAGVGELREALGRHGLTADTVQISGTTRTTEAADANRVLAAAVGGTRTEQASAGSSSNSSQQQSREQSQQHARDAQRDGQHDSTRDGERRPRRDAQQDADDHEQARQRSRRASR